MRSTIQSSKNLVDIHTWWEQPKVRSQDSSERGRKSESCTQHTSCVSQEHGGSQERVLERDVR